MLQTTGEKTSSFQVPKQGSIAVVPPPVHMVSPDFLLLTVVLSNIEAAFLVHRLRLLFLSAWVKGQWVMLGRKKQIPSFLQAPGKGRSSVSFTYVGTEMLSLSSKTLHQEWGDRLSAALRLWHLSPSKNLPPAVQESWPEDRSTSRFLCASRMGQVSVCTVTQQC